MKMAIVGVGNVGSATAFLLSVKGIASEISLIDIDQDLACGEAMDLMHGTSLLASPVRISFTEYEGCKNANIIIITAGSRRKPDQSRLDLIKTNAEIMKKVVANITKYNQNCILIVVSNPVDILTYLTYKLSNFPVERVIGLGTLLDSTRLRSYLSEYLNIPAHKINAFILGEHGESMVPIWSQARVNGNAITNMENVNKEMLDEIFEKVKKSGAEVIKFKGGASFAVALCVLSVIESIVTGRERVFPLCSYLENFDGIKDNCLSVLTMISQNGIEDRISIKMTSEEESAFFKSAQIIKSNISSL